MTMSLTIPGKPAAKQRPRITRKGHAYTPDATVNAETLIRLAAMEAGWTPLQGPVRLTVHGVFAIPKSWPKARREAGEGAWCTKRPDLDNLAKLAGDALNGIAYNDDCQVAELVCRKTHGAAPRTIITVEPLE